MPYPVQCLTATLLQLQPGHVLCQLGHPNIVGAVAALATGAERVLLSFRNADPRNFSFYDVWMRPHYRELARSERIVFSGNSRYGNKTYAAWLGLDAARMPVIPNAVRPQPPLAPDSREHLRATLGIPAHAPVIVGVFRLSQEKNPQLFLKVIAGVRQQFPDLVVLHAGTGPDQKAWERGIRTFGLGHTVRSLGSRQDIPELMGMADLLLLTSRVEGLPNVLLEAQAAGLPVVSTLAGGVPEAVHEGASALLADCGDAAALVRHCTLLLRDAAARQRMGEAGRAFIAGGPFTPASLADLSLDALGLPHKPEAVCPLPLLEDGCSIKDVFICKPLNAHFSQVLEPVIFFAKAPQHEWHILLPEGSLRVVQGLPLPDTKSGRIAFDWHTTENWTDLARQLPPGGTAFFLNGACFEPAVRAGLRRCGMVHVLLYDRGYLYRIPLDVPPLRRLCAMVRALLPESISRGGNA